MKASDRAFYVLDFLEQYASLERKATDEIGWIALKFSCSRAQAEKWIAAARRAPRRKKTKT